MPNEELKKEYRTNRETALKYLEQNNYNQAMIFLQRALKSAVVLAEQSSGSERQAYVEQAMSIKNMIDKVGGKVVKSTPCAGAKTGGQNNAKADDSSSKPAPSLESALEELNSLEGLHNVKNRVMQIIQQIRINKFREEQGLPIYASSNHMIFKGNPGTGKTTVARIMGDIFSALGLLSKGHLVEVNARVGLVGKYVGHTAQQTQEVVDSALGGVLFVDEFYTLYKADSGSDFGKEAIDVLLTAVENNRADFVVILAGYSDEMDAAMKSNVGFASRFNWTIEFEDYAPKEMYNILIKLCKKQKFVFEEDPEVVRTAITDRLAELKSARGKYFGNARDVRMLFEKMMARQNIRLGQLSVRELNDKNVLSTLKICDLPTVEELVQSLTDNQL